MIFSVVDQVISDLACESIAAMILDATSARAAATRTGTRVDVYGQLPAALAALGLSTPSDKVHCIRLDSNSSIDFHAHGWPGFVFFPRDHPTPLIAYLRSPELRSVDGVRVIETNVMLSGVVFRCVHEELPMPDVMVEIECRANRLIFLPGDALHRVPVTPYGYGDRLSIASQCSFGDDLRTALEIEGELYSSAQEIEAELNT